MAKKQPTFRVANGIQLVINNYGVHFVAVRDNENKFNLEPLFPDMMNENIDRYLYPYTRGRYKPGL
jgi:hypothetical protein